VRGDRESAVGDVRAGRVGRVGEVCGTEQRGMCDFYRPFRFIVGRPGLGLAGSAVF